jgi:hypothetical protein
VALKGGGVQSNSGSAGTYETGWDAADWNTYIATGPGAVSTWNTNLSSDGPLQGSFFPDGQATWTSAAGSQETGFPVTSVAIVPLQVDLKAVWDLRDPTLLSALKVTPTDVAFNFRSLPRGAGPTDMQRLGETLAASFRVDGLLYGSLARNGSTCLAIFEASLAALASPVEVNDPPDRLP